MHPVITLTTDFGTRDPYVAAMKGVLLAGCPDARIVDLSHEIAPQDVLEGALFLAAAVPRFPAGSVHLVVVDPGVGTARRGLVAAAADQLLVCPDNGLLSVLERAHPLTAVHAIARLPEPAAPASATFHGRDVFAPVAARLAAGAWAPADAGPPVSDPVRLELPVPEARPNGALVASVIHVDRFGNAITNADAGRVPPGASCVVAGRALPVLRTYADAAPGEPLALIGSTGLLEVAVNRGSAAASLGLAVGDRVTITAATAPPPAGPDR